ncbi:hypothetical protein [Microbulbifer hainanensis]|uniref:hypothetical protein n=1 Tax=Microbulbifer hainanensis TaxID=2735675 RepID=UPI001868AB2F|nr:hypothetical protein [Microbulbifer hainanensis]
MPANVLPLEGGPPKSGKSEAGESPVGEQRRKLQKQMKQQISNIKQKNPQNHPKTALLKPNERNENIVG